MTTGPYHEFFFLDKRLLSINLCTFSKVLCTVVHVLLRGRILYEYSSCCSTQRLTAITDINDIDAHEVTVCLPCRLVYAHTSDHDAFVSRLSISDSTQRLDCFSSFSTLVLTAQAQNIELFPHPRLVIFSQTNYLYQRLHVHADTSDHSCFTSRLGISELTQRRLRYRVLYDGLYRLTAVLKKIEIPKLYQNGCQMYKFSNMLCGSSSQGYV